MSAQREMTLQEWVDKLPGIHSAHKEFDSLQDTIAQQAERIAELELMYAAQTAEWQKAYDIAALRQAQLAEQAAKPASGLSWSGFNVYGDEASIKEVRYAIHYKGLVPELQDTLKALRLELSTLKESLPKGAKAFIKKEQQK